MLAPWSFGTAREALERRVGGLPTGVVVDPHEVWMTTVPKPCFPSDGPEAFVGILPGPWDRFRMPFEATLVYRSLHGRFALGKPWEETEIVRLASWAVRRGVRTWHGCRSEADVRAVCGRVDALYAGIAWDGYRPREGRIRPFAGAADGPREGEKRVGAHVVPDELRLGVARNGELIRLGGGRHRLALARILGIHRIPAVVIARHPEHRGALPGLETRPLVPSEGSGPV